MDSDLDPWPLLSEYLSEQCVYFDEEEGREIEQFHAQVQKCFEGFVADKAFHQLIEKFKVEKRATMEDILDDYYVRHALNEARKMVARTLRLSSLAVIERPSAEVGIYLGEATRTYIYGFWQSSVTLSRAALEAALRQELGGRVGPPQTAKLSQLIRFAVSSDVLDFAHNDLALQVEHAANRVLHDHPTNERGAWDTLCAVRGVLMHIYNK